MKKNTTKIIFTIFFCLNIFLVRSQYQWTQKANFPGSARGNAASFSIGHYGYVGGGLNGSTNYNDWWRYDQNTNTWSSIAAYPGSGSVSCTSFSIGAKGYVGLGQTGSTCYTDFWEYDTTTNSWTALASFPGTARYAGFAFVTGTNAYVGCGSTGGPPYLTDFWKYNSLTDSWSSIASITDNGSSLVFSIGKYGYAGCGVISGSCNTSMYKYDTSANTWTAIPSVPYANGINVPSFFTLGDTGYCISGHDNAGHYLYESYSYDAIANTWSSLSSAFPGIPRFFGIGFSIGNKGYVATGIDSIGGVHNDLWQYAPYPTGINEISNKVTTFIYPNPATTEITFKTSGIEMGTLQILDITGRKLENTELINKEAHLNTSGYANGVYFYMISNKAGTLLDRGKFSVVK